MFGPNRYFTIFLSVIILVDSQSTRSIRSSGGSCRDTNPSCSAWANRGQCQINASFMLANCKSSCNSCPTETCRERGCTANAVCTEGRDQQAARCNCKRGFRLNGNQCVECIANSDCGDNKSCRSGSCVNSCDLAKCGHGAVCQLINRRPQCLCPDNTHGNPEVQCHPIPGPSLCQFPFIYKGTTFSACTRESDPENKLWCSTKTDSQKNHQKGNWQHCTGCESAVCGPGTNCMIIQERPHCTGTSPCKFPFVYKNNKYLACTNNDDKNGMFWCSIKTDNQNQHLKGNWKHCTDNDPRQTPTNIGDRAVMGHPATNNQANLQFTKPTSITPTNAHGQESTRHAGCYSLPDPGECRGAFPRFYYNQQTDQCDCFLFGGCDEERVKFTWLSFNECLGTCVPGNKAKGPGCQRVTLEEVTRFLALEKAEREIK